MLMTCALRRTYTVKRWHPFPFNGFGDNQLGRDGSLGLYDGSSPHKRKAKKLWSAEMASKGKAQSEYELVYTGSKVFLNRDGKVGVLRTILNLCLLDLS